MPDTGSNMPIRLRLALACAVAAAIAFALGSWLFISALSASQLGTIDSQLAVELGQAGRYLPADRGFWLVAGGGQPGARRVRDPGR